MSEQAERLILSIADRRETIMQVIRSARDQVRLSVFRCDDFKVLDTLAEAVDRKVRVRALVTHHAKNWEKKLKSLSSFLEAMGAEVHRYQGNEEKYHAKYIVADDEIGLVASLNFTKKCLEETGDFIVLTRDKNCIASLIRLFEADCQSPEAELPPDLSPSLIIGPEQTRRRYLEILGSAEHSIKLVDHRLNDPAVMEVLRNKQDHGLSVQVLGFGALNGMVSHGRMALVDDRFAVTGSTALTAASLDRRREVAITISDPGNILQLKTWFDEMARQRPEASLRLAEFVEYGSGDDDE